jgi:AcrR family transcriptional regulator
MNKTSISKRRQEGGDETAVRERILEAAFAAFMKSGYATTSTLEIATRARVSKRELYALVGNKQEMLIACISERAKRLNVPADLWCVIARPWHRCWLRSGRSSSAR